VLGFGVDELSGSVLAPQDKPAKRSQPKRHCTKPSANQVVVCVPDEFEVQLRNLCAGGGTVRLPSVLCLMLARAGASNVGYTCASFGERVADEFGSPAFAVRGQWYRVVMIAFYHLRPNQHWSSTSFRPRVGWGYHDGLPSGDLEEWAASIGTCIYHVDTTLY
jgi:hypothetical protein